MRSLLIAAVFLLIVPMPVAVAATNTSVIEGNSGTTTVQVTLQRPPGGNSDISGNYQTVDGTATTADNDYIPAAGKFSIPAGQTSSAPILITIVGDLKVEADETFSLQISNVQGGALLDSGPFDFTIINDDVPVFNVADVRVLEGNSGTTNMPFVVTQTAPADIPIQATYRTADITATAGQDYQAASGTLTFAPGESQKIVNVLINGDTIVEPDETLSLTVIPLGIGGAAAVGIGTILNDDFPGPAKLTIVSGNGQSGRLGQPLAQPLVVQVVDANDVPFAGAVVQWKVTKGEAQLQPPSSTTNAQGRASTTATLNSVGAIEVEARVANVPPVTFTLSSQASPVKLTIVSGNGQSGRLGLPLAQPLVVQVVDAIGVPFPGAVVQWKVTKGEALLEPPSGPTNAQGRASTTATLNSVGAIEVEASVANVPPVTFTLSSQTSFEARAKGPVAIPVARALDQVCARNETVFAGVCRALSQLTDDALSPALERIAPQQSGAESKVTSLMIEQVTSGIRSRLATVRHGTERFSVQHLAVDVNGRVLPMPALAQALASGMQSGAAAASAAGESDYNGWSAFLSGNLGTGERIGRFGTLGFDLRSRGVMLGVDRQFGDNVLGVSVNVMRLKSTLNDSAGHLDTDGYALSLYGSRGGLLAGSAAPSAGAGAHYDGVHVEGSLTLGRNRYDAEHIVNIPPLPLSRARSRNNANVFALSAGTGIDAHSGRTEFDASLSGTWSRARIDDLTENGSGPLILFVQGHEIESATGTAGLSVRSAWPVSFGTVLPSFRAEVIHEFKSGARLVTARFLHDRLDTSFTVPIDRPDANYAKVAAGLQAVFARGVSAYVEVTQDALRSDLHFRTIQVNVSKSF